MVVERTQNTEAKFMRNCEVRSCEKIAAALLHGQDLCLTHFLTKAYEYLESFDRRVEGRSAIVCQRMTNLERSRLLDILLWTGELSDRLRCQRSALDDRPALANKLRDGGNAATPQG